MDSEKKNSNFTTQRYFSNYFGIDYSEPNSDKKLSDLVFIQNFDEKITYLLKKFPYPDLVKIILDKLKFSHFQEKIILEELQEALEKSIEENELRCLVNELNTFTSDSYHLDSLEGHFYGNYSRVQYMLGNPQKIIPSCSIGYRNFRSTQSNNEIILDNDINFDDGYETE